MKSSIDAETVVAYTQCQTKAFFLLCTENQGIAHEYTVCLERRALRHKERYITTVKQENTEVALYSSDGLVQGTSVLLEARFSYKDLIAYADVLTRIEALSGENNHTYEPTLIVGTHSLSIEQKTSYGIYRLCPFKDTIYASTDGNPG